MLSNMVVADRTAPTLIQLSCRLSAIATLTSLLISFSPSFARIAPPASEATEIILGMSHDLVSTPLAEHRTVNVVLPASYASEPGRSYPVLYLIDGGVKQDLLHIAGVVRTGAVWGRSAEAIVVGIETKDRRRELTGVTRDQKLLERFPTAGSSARFRDFIRTEVRPLVDSRYRTSGRNVVLGESLAGLFIVETYLRDPALFDGYGAIDPSLWWDGASLSKTAEDSVGAAQKGRSLYLAIAKEQSEDPAASQRVTAAVLAKKLPLCATVRPDQTHATIYQQVAVQALQYLLPPATEPPPEFGFALSCSAGRQP